MSLNVSVPPLDRQQLQVTHLNLKVKEFLGHHRLKMNRPVSFTNHTFQDFRAKSETGVIPRDQFARETMTSGGGKPGEQSSFYTLIPLSAIIVMSILFFCYLLPYLSWRFKNPLTSCCLKPNSQNGNNNNTNIDTTPYIANRRGWWFEQLRWIRRDRNVQHVAGITRTRESSVRFSTRLKKITYTANGETHFQEVRCGDGDDIAEEVSIHIAESDNDDQDTTVYGDLGRPKTFSDASACSYEIPEVVVHKVPNSDSSVHLHPHRTMSTKSHETRKKLVRPTSLLCSTSSNPLPVTAIDVRTAWSDPNIAASIV